jgi:lantibiotic modifying enzyme
MRRAALAAVVLATVAVARQLATETASAHAGGAATPAPQQLLAQAADSILAHHVPGPGGGWAWRSAIQAPHLQTDRDVGAASVGIGLIAAYQATGDAAYLGGAEQAASWLLAIARPVGGGLRWPDHVDALGRYSGPYYTAFDDGAIGIADFLWRLYAIDGRAEYRLAALRALAWEESQARGVGSTPCPVECRWGWSEEPGAETFTGMGQGIAGVGYAFDLFAQRTGEASYRSYAVGAATYLESQISASGAMPEHPGQQGYDTGFLNGSAGDALFFLDLYRHTGEARWLADARRLLSWVRSQAVIAGSGLAWPIEVGPGGEGDSTQALGTEEGNAGIGWVELQAYAVTHDAADLETAVAAGDYLVEAAIAERGGIGWLEDVGGSVVHTSLDNGASGIGFFLFDLGLATGERRYAEVAGNVVPWLAAISRSDAKGVWWYDERNRRARWRHPREMSWHWGSAGIVTFLARLGGWPTDMPVEEAGGP